MAAASAGCFGNGPLCWKLKGDQDHGDERRRQQPEAGRLFRHPAWNSEDHGAAYRGCRAGRSVVEIVGEKIVLSHVHVEAALFPRPDEVGDDTVADGQNAFVDRIREPAPGTAKAVGEEVPSVGCDVHGFHKGRVNCPIGDAMAPGGLGVRGASN